MSISLTVKLVKPIVISAVLPKIGAALREVLGLSFTPTIVAEEYVSRARVPLRSDTISLESGMIFFEVANEPEIASVVTYQTEHPLLSSEEQGVFTGVEVGSQRSPLEYALAAAVAAAFGRESGAPVDDYVPFFSEALSQSPDSFINAIRVGGAFDDYRVAAQTFYESLPRNVGLR